MQIKFTTNAKKSQFRNVGDGVWQILNIPIAVDDAVMNWVHYAAADNALGLPSYMDQPVMLRHPLDDNGGPVSALSAKALMDNFAGGRVINTYNTNGVNYADVEFKEKLMRAQDGGEYYINALNAGDDIGVSTGLFFTDNNESGINAKGEKYLCRAINQKGNHLAFLPSDEAPAGGDATKIQFNGENADQVFTVNIDEFIAQVEIGQEAIDSFTSNTEEKSLLRRFVDSIKHTFASNKNESDNSNREDKNELLTNQEGGAMRTKLIAQLAAKGITVNAEISDADLLAKYDESNKAEVPDVTAAINTAIAPLAETITALKAEMATNSDKDLTELATQAAPLMGLEVDEAKTMGINSLHKVLAKHGVVVGNVIAANHQSPQDKAKEDICLEPWNKETK